MDNEEVNMDSVQENEVKEVVEEKVEVKEVVEDKVEDKTLNLDGKSEDYVKARFDLLIESIKKDPIKKQIQNLDNMYQVKPKVSAGLLDIYKKMNQNN